MEYIKGFTWGSFNHRGAYIEEQASNSLKLMVKRTGINSVVLAPAGVQKSAQSLYIDYCGEYTVSDEELILTINKCHKLGLRVILKPTVNCLDGTWRAHINFFDIDVPCEPKWSEWFGMYDEFILHYAKIAEETNCFMFVVGCEMVQAQRREQEFRTLVSKVKEAYSGLVTYNTDKYQEGEVKWWDALDVISSSGYYPINDWDNQLTRIKKVVEKYNKPFFFIEAGCPSRIGSSLVPNNWELQGGPSLKEQEKYYEVMFEKTKDAMWIQGFGLWDWQSKLYEEDKAKNDNGYDVYGKPAEKIIKKFYDSK
ncbi:1,4-beta-xylanase [Clostridium sp.]|uniref:glycoside hydrolase family 113 n=1 Tax=Clostridium sp. TaxID=1506 RepID=UPI001A615848|nr:1,4-beta-xylanase [Clostridium sp.]MBK5235624.1 1,4-beta-xylanase [Clostridium sp.]